MFSYSLNLALAWVLRHQLPGVRNSAIFHLASEFSKWSLEELNAGRQKERPIKPKKPKLQASGFRGLWKDLMKWEGMGCEGGKGDPH